jgi:hypothetical protein
LYGNIFSKTQTNTSLCENGNEFATGKKNPDFSFQKDFDMKCSFNSLIDVDVYFLFFVSNKNLLFVAIVILRGQDDEVLSTI